MIQNSDAKWTYQSSKPESSGFGTGVSGQERAETCTESPAKPEFLHMAGVFGYLPLESSA
jgi:hypothetical protein